MAQVVEAGMASDDGFLSRWSRRKVQARSGDVVPPELDKPVVSPTPPVLASGMVATDLTPSAKPPDTANQADLPVAEQATPQQPALPTMDDVHALTKESDFTRFVKPGVDPGVRNAAFKQLFTDPLFNQMDGLDIYIDDYSQPNPLPLSLARKLTSSKVLNLFETPEEKAARRAAEASKSAQNQAAAVPHASTQEPVAQETSHPANPQPAAVEPHGEPAPEAAEEHNVHRDGHHSFGDNADDPLDQKPTP